MPDTTSCASWWSFLASISPAVAGLLGAISLWVASQARTISRDAQQTSQATLSLSLLASEPPMRNGSATDVPDPKNP